jgi:hypothetical protein
MAEHQHRGLGRGLALVADGVGLRPPSMVHCPSRSICRARAFDQLSHAALLQGGLLHLGQRRLVSVASKQAGSHPFQPGMETSSFATRRSTTGGRATCRQHPLPDLPIPWKVCFFSYLSSNDQIVLYPHKKFFQGAHVFAIAIVG